MSKKIPASASSQKGKNKTPKAYEIDYMSSHPCWRISSFDKDGPWGLASLGKFKFFQSDNLLETLVDGEDNEELSKALDDLENKEYENVSIFWQKFSSLYNKPVSLKVISAIGDCIVSNVFMEKIYPKLEEFEKISWEEIRLQNHRRKDKMVSNNHMVKAEKLSPLAKDRLKVLKFDDRDEIYSLRLEGQIRIYGFREQNYMDIVWIDLDHSVYSDRK